MLILHGQNMVLSRQRLTDQLESFSGEVIRLDGEKIGLTELKQALESASLFGHDRLVVIENFFSRPPSKTKETLIGYCKRTKPQNLIIWEGKKIDGRALTAFSWARIQKFEIKPIIFKLLDSLVPNNRKISLVLFHQCLDQESAEMIFYMLARQIRYLLIAADLGDKGLNGLAPWQRTQFVRQAKKFKPEGLLSLYQKLLKIDYQQKTGKTPFPLASQLDLLIASL